MAKNGKLLKKLISDEANNMATHLDQAVRGLRTNAALSEKDLFLYTDKFQLWHN